MSWGDVQSPLCSSADIALSAWKLFEMANTHPHTLFVLPSVVVISLGIISVKSPRPIGLKNTLHLPLSVTHHQVVLWSYLGVCLALNHNPFP